MGANGTAAHGGTAGPDPSRLDELTGLLGKHAFFEEAGGIFAAHPAGTYALMRWDIDRFRVYNDLFGPAAGDDLLRSVGAFVKANRPRLKGAAFARLESDHFVCCMALADYDEARTIGLIEEALKAARPDFRCTARIGAYRVTDPSIDVSLMCDRALLALRSTKGTMAQAAWYDKSMSETEAREQGLLAEVTGALGNGEFGIYLQPQFDQYAETVSGVEALARWFHPARGVLEPSEFIPVMESNGITPLLDEAVWDKAAAFLSSLEGAGERPPTVSVNVSRQSLHGKGLVEKLLALTERHGIEPRQLHLEVTETTYMDRREHSVSVVRSLREKGFVVEMDDFGSEYSSLNALKELPIDLLKLDTNFLPSADDRQGHGGIILSSVIRMAHWLDLRVIAEGVETAQQASYLKSVGCRYAQGFFYAPPLPEDECRRLLQEKGFSPAKLEHFTESYFNGIDFWRPESQATAMFNTLVGAAGIFEYDGSSVECVCINDAYRRTFGTSNTDLTAYKGRVLDPLPESDRQRVTETLDRARDNGDEHSLDVRYVGQAGGEKATWLNIRLRRIAHSIDRTVFYVAIENITARKEAERQRAESEQVARAMVSMSDRVAYRYDMDARSLAAIDARACLRHGLPAAISPAPDEAIDRQVVHPEDAGELRRFFESLHRGQERGMARFRLKTMLSSDYRWFEGRFSVSERGEGARPLAVVSFLDVEDTHEREMAYNRYRGVIQDSIRGNLAYLEVDLTADLVVKQGGGELFGRIENMVGRSYSGMVLHVAERFLAEEEEGTGSLGLMARDRLLASAAAGAGTLHKEFLLPRFREGGLWVRAELQFFSDPFTGHVMTFMRLYDVTDEKSRSERLRFRAERDGMTGIYNKETIEGLIRRRLAEGSGTALLLLIDLDDLKGINDTFGHAEGDRAIRMLAGALRTGLRETDLVGRAGGDEFMVLLPGIATPGQAEALLESLLQRIADRQASSASPAGALVHCSIGAAFAACGETDFDTAYRQADRALYSVKGGRKNGYALYTPEMGLR